LSEVGESIINIRNYWTNYIKKKISLIDDNNKEIKDLSDQIDFHFLNDSEIEISLHSDNNTIKEDNSESSVLANSNTKSGFLNSDNSLDNCVVENSFKSLTVDYQNIHMKHRISLTKNDKTLTNITKLKFGIDRDKDKEKDPDTFSSSSKKTSKISQKLSNQLSKPVKVFSHPLKSGESSCRNINNRHNTESLFKGSVYF
jgi:hypothetical protein